MNGYYKMNGYYNRLIDGNDTITYSEEELLNYEEKISEIYGEKISINPKLRNHLLNKSRYFRIENYLKTPFFFDLNINKDIFCKLKHNYSEKTKTKREYEENEYDWFPITEDYKIEDIIRSNSLPDEIESKLIRFYNIDYVTNGETYHMTLNGDIYELTVYRSLWKIDPEFY